MKKISLAFFLALLFIPSLVYAEDITTEADLRTCLSGEETICNVTADITLSSDLTLPFDKTLQFSNGADLSISNGYGFVVNGHLYMDDDSGYSLDAINSNILFGNHENAFYASGTPENCVGIFGTTSTFNLCGETTEVVLSKSISEDTYDNTYFKSTLFSSNIIFDVKGELKFTKDTEVPSNFIINTDDPTDAYLIFEKNVVNNGIINVAIMVSGNFTNNVENGLTQYVNVYNGGTFINNEDITLIGMYVDNGANTFINKADVTIASQSSIFPVASKLRGIINNTGTISYIQQNPTDSVFFGYNKKNYTGEYPKLTYTKNLDYSKRIYLSDTFIESVLGDKEYKVENGLLLYVDVNTDLNYYKNLISADKNEYNVVASTRGLSNMYLELLFDSSQAYVNVEYENLDGINLMFSNDFFGNSLVIDNDSFDSYMNSDDYYGSNYSFFKSIDADKPIYFKYKVKGFTNGEEVLIQGAVTPNDELSALFESNGGSYTYPVFETAEHLITKPTDPTKPGYTFKGWYTEKELTNKFVFETPIEDNIVLYASWENSVENPDTHDNIGVYMLITMFYVLGIGCTIFIKVRH